MQLSLDTGFSHLDFLSVDIVGSDFNWSSRTTIKAFLAVIALLLVIWSYTPTFMGITAPYAGYSSNLVPGAWVRFQFTKGARDIVDSGYKHWKNVMFKLSRTDRDILVLPNKYIDELRNLPGERLSSIVTLVRNNSGKYGGTDVLLESEIATQAIQTRITPQIALLMHPMKEELDYALSIEAPICKDWTPIKVHPFFATLVARVSNRAFVGKTISRDKRWAETVTDFTSNVAMTTMILRGIPPILHGLAVLFMPTYWTVQRTIRDSLTILGPEISRRRRSEAEDPSYKKPVDLLQGMMDLAKPGSKQSTARDLAHRQLVMSLAAVHTTAGQAANTLFDLCVHPEYFDILREEIIIDVVNDPTGWDKQSLNKLKKLDSFLKEAQRMNPPSLLGFHRSVEGDGGIRLKDGKYLPRGTHVCMASYATTYDPDYVSNPSKFDPLRFWRMRQKTPEDANKHQFATTSNHFLHFGHGKFSCPGRFFASNELKLLFSTLLLRYDFKFKDGQQRPKSVNIDEFLFADPEAEVLIRERENPLKF
ncbi:P450 monooxygenase [Ustulina deusta]|nr:P450 monooxygenase [Ustulina deusta]